MEYEAKREKIQNELNHQKEAEERRTQQVRALASSRDQEVRALERLGAIPRQPTRNMERDLELLDIQREQFYSGLVDSHARQQQQMEEYELALGESCFSHNQPPSTDPSLPFADHRTSSLSLSVAAIFCSALSFHGRDGQQGKLPLQVQLRARSIGKSDLPCGVPYVPQPA